MKLNELIFEAPLPEDWEEEIYNEHISFAKRIRYAVERAQKIGTGSSRVAFEIEYKGRPTILKIAKNRKGMAQNEAEAEILGDWYAKNLDIMIPMIDYDERGSSPTWIHMEKASKMTKANFKKFFEVPIEEAIWIVDYMAGNQKYAYEPNEEEKNEWNDIYEDNEYLQSLVDLVGNYNLPSADFKRLANWGMYKNEPVIIDVGVTKELIAKYYS